MELSSGVTNRLQSVPQETLATGTSSPPPPIFPKKDLSRIVAFDPSYTNDAPRLVGRVCYYAEAEGVQGRIDKTKTLLETLLHSDIDPPKEEFNNFKDSLAPILDEIKQLKGEAVDDILAMEERFALLEGRLFLLLTSLTPPLFNSLEITLPDFGRFFVLAKLHQDIEDDQARESLVEDLIKHHEISKALQIAESIRGDRYKFVALKAVAEALANAGNIEGSFEIVKSVINVDWKGTALKDIAEALAKEGSVDHALKIANSIRGVGCRFKTFQVIAIVLAKAENIDQALAIIDNSITKDGYKFNALQAIAGALAKAGNIARALAIANSIIDKDCKFSALQAIAGALAESGEIEHALEIANSIRHDSCQSSAHKDIVEAVVKAGNIARALGIANFIINHLYKFKALKAIAKAVATVGNIEFALKIVNSMELEIVNSREDDDYKSRALKAVAKTLAKAGDIEHALEIANSITDGNRRRSKALGDIATALVNTRELGRARSVAASIEADDLKSLAFEQIESAPFRLILNNNSQTG